MIFYFYQRQNLLSFDCNLRQKWWQWNSNLGENIYSYQKEVYIQVEVRQVTRVVIDSVCLQPFQTFRGCLPSTRSQLPKVYQFHLITIWRYRVWCFQRSGATYSIMSTQANWNMKSMLRFFAYCLRCRKLLSSGIKSLKYSIRLQDLYLSYENESNQSIYFWTTDHRIFLLWDLISWFSFVLYFNWFQCVK